MTPTDRNEMRDLLRDAFIEKAPDDLHASIMDQVEAGVTEAPPLVGTRFWLGAAIVAALTVGVAVWAGRGQRIDVGIPDLAMPDLGVSSALAQVTSSPSFTGVAALATALLLLYSTDAAVRWMRSG